jgi:hypothetical protein
VNANGGAAQEPAFTKKIFCTHEFAQDTFIIIHHSRKMYASGSVLPLGKGRPTSGATAQALLRQLSFKD